VAAVTPSGLAQPGADVERLPLGRALPEVPPGEVEQLVRHGWHRQRDVHRFHPIGLDGMRVGQAGPDAHQTRGRELDLDDDLESRVRVGPSDDEGLGPDRPFDTVHGEQRRPATAIAMAGDSRPARIPEPVLGKDGRGHRVVVLEARKVGAVTTGNTTGKLSLTYLKLFDAFGDEKSLFDLDISIPIPGASIGGVGLEARIGGGAKAGYSIGPGSLGPITFTGEFYPLEENSDLKLEVEGMASIPATARLTAYIKGGIVLDALIAEVGGELILSGWIELKGGASSSWLQVEWSRQPSSSRPAHTRKCLWSASIP